MDVKSAFVSVGRARLGRCMEAHEIELAASCRTARSSSSSLRRGGGPASPQGSPAAPTLFITHLSGIFNEVERAVPGIRAVLR